MMKSKPFDKEKSIQKNIRDLISGDGDWGSIGNMGGIIKSSDKLYLLPDNIDDEKLKKIKDIFKE